MEDYTKYKYIYPPRPELKISRDNLEMYDNNMFIAQPKLNGSCCEIYTGDDKIIQKGRHNNTLTLFTLSDNEIKMVFGNDFNLIVGEYMNKSKKDNNDKLFNHKFVIFDQLVFNGKYLLGSTFKERMDKMLEIYKPIGETKYLYQLSENIYMVKTFYKNFGKIWDKITKHDMHEGLVLKMKNGRLERGIREKNNHMIQLKCRKETKNYSF